MYCPKSGARLCRKGGNVLNRRKPGARAPLVPTKEQSLFSLLSSVKKRNGIADTRGVRVRPHCGRARGDVVLKEAKNFASLRKLRFNLLKHTDYDDYVRSAFPTEL